MARQLTRIEARSIDFVPDSERHGKVSDQGPFWFLGNFHFFTIAIGFVGPGMHLSLGWTALAATTGVLFGTLFQAFHASQGAELGLPQMIQSRAQFGYRGVVVPLVGALFTFLGFNVVNSILVAEGLNHLWGWDAHAVIAVFAVLAASLAIWGHDWLHLAFRSLFWLSLPLFTVLSVGIGLGFVHAAGPVGSDAAGFNWPAFTAQFAAAASYNIAYAPYVSDYSRYLPRTVSRTAIIANVFVGASLSAIWLICLGAWLASRMGATDGLIAIAQAGNGLAPHLGDGLVICSVAALLATTGMNAYSGMLSVITGLDSIRQIQPTRGIRVVTILLLASFWALVAASAQGDAIETLSATLVVMLYLLCPWTAVNLVDYFFVRKGRYAITDLARPDGIYGAFGVRGLAGYFVGLFASAPFFVIPAIWTGPVARALGGTDIAWLVGLVVAAGVYLLASRGFSAASEDDAIAASEAEIRALSYCAG
ncbi:MAG: purine-cytosine permease family protein [Novosphingobium sp.]